jgi:hypothetical protein
LSIEHGYAREPRGDVLSDSPGTKKRKMKRKKKMTMMMTMMGMRTMTKKKNQ